MKVQRDVELTGQKQSKSSVLRTCYSDWMKANKAFLKSGVTRARNSRDGHSLLMVIWRVQVSTAELGKTSAFILFIKVCAEGRHKG